MDDIADELNKKLNINTETKWLLNPFKQHTVDGSKICMDKLVSWIAVESRSTSLRGEHKFCDATVLDELLALSDEQTVNFTREEILDCRKRSNPCEAIGSVGFVNRASTKFANLDALLKFSMNSPSQMHKKKPVSTKKTQQTLPKCSNAIENEEDDDDCLLTFVDIGGGPGGFVDYLLWRRGWQARGIGITLKDGVNTNYNFGRFASNYDSFDTYMGIERDGNILSPKNVQSFWRYVNRYHSDGVQLAVADGAVDVLAPSSLKELISKNLIVCHVIIALSALQPGGMFVTKLFNTFTPFTVGLVYLLYQCFERIAIVKPAGSRPVNSERYLVGSKMKAGVAIVRKHLEGISRSMLAMMNSDTDVTQLVDHGTLTADRAFFEYICASNNDITRTQIVAMRYMCRFKDDAELVDPRQDANRVLCLQQWNLPESVISQQPPALQNCTRYVDDLLGVSDAIFDARREQLTMSNIRDTIGRIEDEWSFVTFSQHNDGGDGSKCTWFVGTGGANVFARRAGEWIANDDSTVLLVLPPKTLIYAELVHEHVADDAIAAAKPRQNVALHIIDGQMLGGIDLRGMSFAQRHHQCRRFAKAINCLGSVYKNRAGKYGKKVEIRCKPRRSVDGIMKSLAEWQAALDGNGTVALDVHRIEMPAKGYRLGGVIFVENKVSQAEWLWWPWAGNADVALQSKASTAGSVTAFHFRKIFG